MNSHNICFCGDIREISLLFIEKSTLSVGMSKVKVP